MGVLQWFHRGTIIGSPKNLSEQFLKEIAIFFLAWEHFYKLFSSYKEPCVKRKGSKILHGTTDANK